MRAFKRFGAIVGLAGLAWVLGLIWFAASQIPAELTDPDSRTDAIVVLTGGSERLATGFTLLRGDQAREMLVSGVGAPVDHDALFLAAGEDGTLKDRVALGHVAGDTTGNAYETAAWMRARGYRSLRLVTAGYHMPRSLLELRHAMPEALIVPHPVFPERVKQDEWWRWPGTASLIAREYTKYLVALLRLWLQAVVE